MENKKFNTYEIYRDNYLYTTNPLFIYKFKKYIKYEEMPCLGFIGALLVLISCAFYGEMIQTHTFSITLCIIGSLFALSGIVLIVLGICFAVLRDNYSKVFEEFRNSDEYKKQLKQIDINIKRDINRKKNKKATELVEVYSILNSKQSKEDKVKLIQKYMKED